MMMMMMMPSDPPGCCCCRRRRRTRTRYRWFHSRSHSHSRSRSRTLTLQKKTVFAFSLFSLLLLMMVVVMMLICFVLSWSGCCSLAYPHNNKQDHHRHSQSRHITTPQRLADLLPKDLDPLFRFVATDQNDKHNNNGREGQQQQQQQQKKNHNLLLGALGAQLLLLGGWRVVGDGFVDDGQTTNQPRPWERRPNNNITSTILEDRLAFLTPSWKKGGSIDYDLLDDSKNNDDDDDDGSNIFQLGSQLLYSKNEDSSIPTTTTTMAQLGDLLQDKVGVTVRDYYGEKNPRTLQAMQAMLSWDIPEASTGRAAEHYNNNNNNVAKINQRVMLFIFSFGSNEYCNSPEDCPFGPGATNELLAATAASYVQDFLSNHHKNKQNKHKGDGEIHIVAQWEVYTALQYYYLHDNGAAAPFFPSSSETTGVTITLTSVGSPGSYETTADIFELMLCHWYQHKYGTTTVQDAILLAHPDHLRRVWWTSETLRHNRLKESQELGVTAGTTTAASSSSCGGFPQDFLKSLRLVPAMVPYSTNWHNIKHDQQSLRGKRSNINLFAKLSEPVQVHINGLPIRTTWYDDEYLGFFPDASNSQKWTHDRRVWILYDHWAVLKGIVTGTIDIDIDTIDTSNHLGKTQSTKKGK